MSSDRFKLPAAVFLILINSDEVLLSRRYNTGWSDGDFDLVAGHIDGQEGLTTALVREAKEEMGIDIKPDDAKFSHLSHSLFSDGKEYFNIFFIVETWKGVPRIMEPDKCDDLQWFPIDDLPNNITPSTRLGINALKQEASYSESGFKGPR